MNEKHSQKTRAAVLRDTGSNKDIAARHGVSTSWVGKLRKKHGMVNTTKARHAKIRAQALKMASHGHDDKTIAKALGIHHSTAWKWRNPEMEPRKYRPAQWVIAAMEGAK